MGIYIHALSDNMLYNYNFEGDTDNISTSWGVTLSHYSILLVAKLTQLSVYCQSCNSDDNSSSGASPVLCLVMMHFMILPHANCDMNLSEAKVGHLGNDKHSWQMLAYLSSRNVVTSAWLFSSFSPFILDHHGNDEPLLTLFWLLLWSDSIWDG